MTFPWRYFLLACLGILLLAGLSAYYILGEDESRNLARHPIRFLRYLLEDLTGSNSRDEWK
ncbi:MAG: hypothetical protein JNJ77_13825 [Planctomycetia bacterium]|nr:hypothetical protein [Planctomycetia bacterium]